MNIDTSALGAAEQAQLAQLLRKLQPAAAESAPKRVKKPRTELKYFTEVEIEQFFRAAAVSARDTAIFRLIYHRGLRAREVGRLQLADWIQRDDRLIFRRLKKSAGGEYHLTSREVRALKAWLRERGNEPGPLFPSRLGRGISQQMLDVLVKRYGAAAGIPREKCHSHAFKHSCGTHLLNRGEAIEDVKDHLGHRNIQNTLVYAQYTNKRRHERDKRLRDW
jgi:integrase